MFDTAMGTRTIALLRGLAKALRRDDRRGTRRGAAGSARRASASCMAALVLGATLLGGCAFAPGMTFRGG
ncbi:hypothetical protein, partial [Burkholderia sp. Cy-637]|uniref:hypothetical protein n=1 Tax=Burkholderia sp. Cy-637 TaxID=2608327 RepID=UPI0019656A27